MNAYQRRKHRRLTGRIHEDLMDAKMMDCMHDESAFIESIHNETLRSSNFFERIKMAIAVLRKQFPL